MIHNYQNVTVKIFGVSKKLFVALFVNGLLFNCCLIPKSLKANQEFSLKNLNYRLQIQILWYCMYCMSVDFYQENKFNVC